ncbi:MAG: SIS domain-containing protein [Chitinophagaceae bacterium]|nr:SIS domain-containing protein [Chitinophagaceae bacterium]
MKINSSKIPASPDTSDSVKKLLGFELETLKNNGGYFTAKEITQQPLLWTSTWQLVKKRKEALESFLNEAYQQEALTVILTGAGTSAFIGSALQGPFQKNTRKNTVAIATTDLISHPAHYFTDQVVLLISFARSGDSPESVAAVNLANGLCKKIFHLIITCNPSGKLALAKSVHPACIFLLPPESDDQSLVMTGSFTSMLLAGLLISRIKEIEDLEGTVQQLSVYATNILNNYSEKLRAVARLHFQRAVFLGSGPLRSVANESDLKLQELTGGKVICKFDSFLGFRHGPKAVIDASTLLVYLFSNNGYVHQYEQDLVKSITSGEKGLFSIGIAETARKDMELDLQIVLSPNDQTIEEEFLSVCSVLPAQILGWYKSLELGLTPDNPSENETITRVVKGVTIYPFKHEK